MVIKNQGYRRDLNLEEHTDDAAVWDNLYSAGISNDLAVLRNNLRNTSTVGFNSITGDGTSGIASFFSFIGTNGEPTEFIFTNDDVVGLSHTVTFGTGAGSTTLTYGTDYYVCNSNGRNQFKLSVHDTDHISGISTIKEITANPTAIDGPTGSGATTFSFIRKDPVHRENLVNFIEPETQDDKFSWSNSVPGDFAEVQSRIESAEYFVTKKYKGNGDTITDRDIKFEGSTIVSDPANSNSNQANVDSSDSPGVFIGDTRAFSTDNNPWTTNGTAGTDGATLKTESDEVSIGEIFFETEVEIQGVSRVSVGATTLGSYNPGTQDLWKVPVVINGETYFLLLDQRT